MKFEQLKKELDSNVFRRVYIFTGPEKGVLGKYLKRVGVTATYQNFSEILPLLRGKTLFESSQTIAVREGFEDYEYSKLIELCGKKHRLVLLPETIDGRKKLYKEAADLVVEFLHFTSEQLEYYVQNQFFLANSKLGSEECRLIAERCNNDVLAIDNACHKLNSLGEPICLSVIQELLSPIPEDRIFDLADEIVFGNAKKAFGIIFELYQLKLAELQMLVVIYNHFKALLQIQHYFSKSDFDLAKITGLHPFVVNKKRPMAKNIRSDDYYLEALRKLYRVEQDIKLGRVPAKVAFINLIFTLIKK